jgi:hypothetical protein
LMMMEPMRALAMSYRVCLQDFANAGFFGKG